MEPIIIGVAGGTGSGKTTVTRQILSRVGEERIAYIPHDAYYRDLAHLPPNLRTRINFDHPDSLETDLYSTKKPFDFGAGGKGLDLLRIKMFGKTYNFKIECSSVRCKYIPREIDACPGSIAKCLHVDSKKQCSQSGGSVFKLIMIK